MINRIWLHPPLALARVGASPEPCAAFLWGPNDTSPRGTGSTTLQPTETLSLSSSGEVSARVPADIRFRDDHGIRPVCPFFELHAERTDPTGKTQQGAVTRELLAAEGLELTAVTWEVLVSNAKAFHYSLEPGDRVDAQVALSGADTRKVPLLGISPADGTNQLATAAAPLPLGAVQLAAPSASFPELRLRFYAPAGTIYAPRDIEQRMAAVDFGLAENAEWRGFRVAKEQQILNPDAAWSRYIPELASLASLAVQDYRNTPGGLLATLTETIPWLPEQPQLQRSLGLLDDTSDGVVHCRLELASGTLTAVARVVVGPPDFAPANRPPVSLADNLSDREDRQSARTATWTKAELGELVVDIFERAFETSQLVNKDYQNGRSTSTNRRELIALGSRSMFDAEDVQAMLWPVVTRQAVIDGESSALPLTELGTRRHRRNLAVEYLEDRWRENPQLFEQWIRRPLDPSPFFDKRMPALMRGSDGRPHHLTRRQWEIVRAWIDALRAEATAADSSEAP